MAAFVPAIQVIETSGEEEESKLKKMKPHVPGIIIFADHNRTLPWSVTYHSVVMFADISGFTALCERYSTMGQSGIDQLTRTLNEYLSALVEGILGSDGDILKFAGDAILAIWRVGREEELHNEVLKVAKCCLDIQEKCGEWDTDIGVKLTVKIGLAAGVMSVTFLGNKEYRHYVELGPAVTAVNAAEHFCRSGMVVVSPDTWKHCDKSLFELETMEDDNHVRIIHIIPPKRSRSQSMPAHLLKPRFRQERRMSDDLGGGINKADLAQFGRSERRGSITSSKEKPFVIVEESKVSVTTVFGPRVTSAGGKKEMKGMVQDTLKMGPRFGKLRKIVTTVTEMKLDIALRLYILTPVLRKLDDKQPLEYLSEMRQVSIVFMNLVLGEDQDTAQLLQKIFELIYSKTKAMHGSLNKVFLFDKGCTFLVIFGLPGFKHENDGAHALMCSGRMKSQLDKIQGVKTVSIGVTTGTTFCGVVGHPKRHEYSVIGRKVNMAARLMMHYPGKVTCDTETFQTGRLPPSFFEVLITQAMKGIKNVGVIRQFVGFSKDEKMVAKAILHSDYPILGRHLEEYMFREQLVSLQAEDNKRRHLVFSGPSGIGKSRLLDRFITLAQHAKCQVISCRVELEDSSYPYFVTSHVLNGLLSNKGCSKDVTKDPSLLDALGSSNVDYIYLLNDVLGCQNEPPDSLVGVKFDEGGKRRELLRNIASMCLQSDFYTIIVIDDAHNIDTSSWEFFCELIPNRHCLIVLTIRPNILDAPTCRECVTFINDFSVKLVDLGSLDVKFMAPLACQMMNVTSIPYDLDKLLRERAHGVPNWCMELLRDMLEKGQLRIALDTDEENMDFSVVPNTALLAPLSSGSKLVVPDLRLSLSSSATNKITTSLQEFDGSEMKILSAMGYLHNALNISKSQVSQSQMCGGGALHTRNLLKVPSNIAAGVEMKCVKRIVIFATGIKADEIPVPPAMKEMVTERIDSMRDSDQLLVKCAAVLGTTVRRDVLETLLPKAHRSKLPLGIRRLMESGIFQCSKMPTKQTFTLSNEKSVLATHKYMCYCNPRDIPSKLGDIEACFEPMFTNKLLQETAYDILIESQRVELHSKAAVALELVADEIRKKIPYYMLCRPPSEDLNEQLKRIDMKMQDIDAVISIRANHIAHNQVTDDLYARQAKDMRAKRGRRKALQVSIEETIPLVQKIAAGGTPMDCVMKQIESLLPLYDSLIYHWKIASYSSGLLHSLVEAVAASIAIKRFEKASKLMEMAVEKIENEPTPPGMDEEFNMFTSRLYRLKGQLLYKSGDVLGAYKSISRAAALLGLNEPEMPHSSWCKKTRTLIKFRWYWKHHAHKRTQTTNICTLEQGYLLADLYRMDKEQGFEAPKLSHALQFFTKVSGNPVHIHQVLSAYAAMIECCQMRNWLEVCESLQAELLQVCADRSDEMSSGDRCILGELYARSCIHYFSAGNLQKAGAVGRAANEICSCIQDQETMKLFTPYYFFVCLFKNVYYKSMDLVQQLKYTARVMNDDANTVFFQAICLEIALAGGNPPESAATCLSSLTYSMRTMMDTDDDLLMMPYYYAAMTAALWFARLEQWSEIDLWLHRSAATRTKGESFFHLVASANRLECQLLTLCHFYEHQDEKQAKHLQLEIKKELKRAEKCCKKVPVLIPRFKLLKAYHCAINGNVRKAKSQLKKITGVCSKQGNVFEEMRTRQNINRWTEKKYGRKENKAWITHALDDSKDIDGIFEGSDMIIYTLPLPSKTK